MYLEIGDRVFTRLFIAVRLSKQEVGKGGSPWRSPKVETGRADGGVLGLLHPHRGKAGADGVIPVLDGKIIEDVVVDIPFEVRRVAVP